nr:LCP family protein [Oceanirhabdus seepicola]
MIVLGVLIGKGIASISKKSDTKQFAIIDENVDKAPKEIITPDKEEITFNNEFVNILLVGIDEGDLSENAILNTREADSILLLNYYYNEKVVNVTSIPRDMSVVVEEQYFNVRDALKFGGINYLITSVEGNLKCKVDNYVLLDIELFKEIVDIIGKIDIKIPYDMEYDDNLQDLHIRFTKGETISLDGEMASQYVRWRMNNDGWTLPNNDISRIEHFQNFMIEMLNEFKKPSSYMRLGMVAEAVGKNVTTDVSVVGIARYVLDINEIEKKNITFNTLKGEFTKGVEQDSFIISSDENQELIRLLNGKGIKNINRNEMKVKVIYESDYTQLPDLKEKFKILGYNNVVYEVGKVEESEMLFIEELSDDIDYLVYELGMEKYDLLSQNDEKFDIILKIK